MRNIIQVAVIFLALASPVMAGEAPAQKSLKLESPPTKVLPLKGAASTKSCAGYGAGFVKVDGTDTCMHVGGSMSVGTAGSIGGR